jgi:hypothetical protein
MVKSLIRIALFLVVGILVYNYFFGTPEEKTQSKEVFKKTGQAVGAAWDAVKSEKDKFDAGKYNKVMSQLGDAYRSLRERAQDLDASVLNRLDQLEGQKMMIQTQIDRVEQEQKSLTATDGSGGKKVSEKDLAGHKEKLMRMMDQLVKDTDQLILDAEK